MGDQQGVVYNASGEIISSPTKPGDIINVDTGKGYTIPYVVNPDNKSMTMAGSAVQEATIKTAERRKEEPIITPIVIQPEAMKATIMQQPILTESKIHGAEAVQKELMKQNIIIMDTGKKWSPAPKLSEERQFGVFPSEKDVSDLQQEEIKYTSRGGSPIETLPVTMMVVSGGTGFAKGVQEFIPTTIETAKTAYKTRFVEYPEKLVFEPAREITKSMATTPSYTTGYLAGQTATGAAFGKGASIATKGAKSSIATKEPIKVKINPTVRVSLAKADLVHQPVMMTEKGQEITGMTRGKAQLKIETGNKAKIQDVEIVKSVSHEMADGTRAETTALMDTGERKLIIKEKSKTVPMTDETSTTFSKGEIHEIVKGRTEKVGETAGGYKTQRMAGSPETSYYETKGATTIEGKPTASRSFTKTEEIRAETPRRYETEYGTVLKTKSIPKGETIIETAKAIAKEEAIKTAAKEAPEVEIIKVPSFQGERAVIQKPRTIQRMKTRSAQTAAYKTKQEQRIGERLRTTTTQQQRAKEETKQKTRTMTLLASAQAQRQATREQTKLATKQKPRTMPPPAITVPSVPKVPKRRITRNDEEEDRKRKHKTRRTETTHIQDPFYNLLGKKKYSKKFNLLRAVREGAIYS